MPTRIAVRCHSAHCRLSRCWASTSTAAAPATRSSQTRGTTCTHVMCPPTSWNARTGALSRIAWVTVGEINHGLGWDCDHRGSGQRCNGMVHARQDKDALVTQITGDEVGHDLPPSIGQCLVAAGPATQDQVDTIRGCVLADEIGVGGNMLWCL